MDDWIPVGERLPEEYELVMVGWAGRRDIGKGYVLAGRWHDPLVGKPDVNQPTHWMPLPEPPVTDEVRALHDVAREIAKAKGPKQTLGDLLMRPPEPPEVK